MFSRFYLKFWWRCYKFLVKLFVHHATFLSGQKNFGPFCTLAHYISPTTLPKWGIRKNWHFWRPKKRALKVDVLDFKIPPIPNT